MNRNTEARPFSIQQILLYHLLPGIPMLLIAILLSNPTWGFGLSIFLSLMLAATFGLIPTLWLIMVFKARKDGIKTRDLIQFTEKMPRLRIIVWALPCMVFALLLFVFVAPIEHPLWTIFDWVPAWFRIDRFSQEGVDKIQLLLIVILNFVVQGFFGPITEECYFRGFLLPRMTRLGKAAPFANVVLFSLYHLFTPWENITRILALTPYVYLVWRKKNIFVGMVTHCSLNVLSAIALLPSVLPLLIP